MKVIFRFLLSSCYKKQIAKYSTNLSARFGDTDVAKVKNNETDHKEAAHTKS